MCTVDKMLIKGVRSFSPDNTAVIEFYRPLTLIVGHNGAGKTTIIECLKQACTGEMPPNSKSGQGFVRDPKLEGETEVKAQIKLRFNTAAGASITVIRNFQLTQKRQKLEFKAIDQVVQALNADGQREAMSYRCADMDRVVPNLMGVSKAVLENVIFVHQEDSNWPLAEARVLKQKFDDIFASTKYTKALEELKRIHKVKTQETREHKLQLEHLTTHQTAAHALRADVAQGQQREAELAAQIAQLEQQLAALKQEMGGMDARMQEWEQKRRALAALQTRLEALAGATAQQQVRLAGVFGPEEMAESLEELQAMRETLEPRAVEQGRTVGDLRERIQEGESRAAAFKRQAAAAVRDEARLAAEAAAAARDRQARDAALRQAAARLGAGGLPAQGELPEEAVDAFMARLRERLAAEEGKLGQLRAAHQRADDERGSAVDGLAVRLAGAEQTARMRRRALQESEAHTGELQRQVEASAVSPVMVADAEEAAAAAQERLDRARQALAAQDFDRELAAVGAATDDVQRRAAALRQERDALSVAAEDGARLQLLRRERNAKQAQLDSMAAARRPQLARALGCAPEEVPAADKLKAALEAALAKLQEQQARAGSELAEARAKAAATKALLAACQALLRRQQGEADALQARLDSRLAQISAGAGEPLDTRAALAEEKVAKEQGRLQRLNYFEINAQTLRNKALSDNCCDVCRRPFAGGEREAFLQLQDETAAQLPAQRSRLTAAVAAAEEKLRALRALQPDAARLASLQATDIAEAEAQRASLDSRAAAEEAAAERLQGAHAELQGRVQAVRQLLADVAWPMDRLAAEVAAATRDAARLERSLAVPGGGRPLPDVDADIAALELEREQQARRRDDLLRRQGRLRDEISHLQASWHAAKEEATAARAAAERQQGLEAELRRLGEAASVLEREAAEATASVQPLQAQRSKLQRERELARAAARTKEGEAEARVQELRQDVQQLQDRCRAVRSYEAAGAGARLAAVREQLAAAQQKLQQEEASLKEAEAQLRTAEQERASEDSTRRQLDDLVDWKRSQAEQARLRAQAEQVQAEIGDQAQIEAFTHRFQELQDAVAELRSQRDRAQGSLGMVREAVAKATKELGAPQYRDIDSRHWTQSARAIVTEWLCEDITTFHKALETVLLTYHTDRMAEINRSIKELWQRTYRGQDIDFIQLRADSEGRSSYNYRVVMHANGNELDMRGRCSTGQKVLACLVIRLALAETFCINCGILALDEPTTNLDAENSGALAEALRSILESRALQENFQLIVITHDERFAQMIGTRQHAEYMWRVTKDEDQHSHIEKEVILE